MGMTNTEAENVLLRQEIDQLCSTAEFLHGCLTQEGYKYGYPEQTASRLQAAKNWLPVKKAVPCAHSKTVVGCASCKERSQHYHDLMLARQSVGLPLPRWTSPPQAPALAADKAYNILYRETIQHLYSLIEFQDGCLQQPQTYEYTYPRQTMIDLQRAREIVPPSAIGPCFHSFYKEGCAGCDESLQWHRERQDALQQLGLPDIHATDSE